jgi:hypothetical protein
MATTSFESKVQKAVETWSEANREVYQAISRGVIATQERNTQLAQTIVESGVSALQSQAETTRTALETLGAATERQWQAASELAQDAVNAYGEFFTAPYASYTKWVEALTEKGL